MQVSCYTHRHSPDISLFQKLCNTHVLDGDVPADPISSCVLINLYGEDRPPISSISEVLSNSLFSGSWVVVVSDEKHFLPDIVSQASFHGSARNFSLSASILTRLERLGRPVVGTARISVYRQMGVTASFPPLPVLYGPGVPASEEDDCGFRLWPKDRFQGCGHSLWSDDPELIEAIYESVHSPSPVPWIQPGFPFALPESMSSFSDVEGNTKTGLLCVSDRVIGGWTLLDESDLSRIFGLDAPVEYSRLRFALGDHCVAALVDWVASFPN